MPQSSISRNANLVGAFAVAVVDRMADAVEESGGSFGSSAAAVLLIHHGHVQRIDDLRAPLGLSQAGAVRLVDRLEASGLARRAAHAGDDRRAVGVKLTAQGSKLARRLLVAREQAVSSLLESLSPAEVKRLARACERSLAGAAESAPSRARLCRYCDEGVCDLNRCPVEMSASRAV
jgi:DNA-binding MarR family transcriptional regulator